MFLFLCIAVHFGGAWVAAERVASRQIVSPRDTDSRRITTSRLFYFVFSVVTSSWPTVTRPAGRDGPPGPSGGGYRIRRGSGFGNSGCAARVTDLLQYPDICPCFFTLNIRPSRNPYPLGQYLRG